MKDGSLYAGKLKRAFAKMRHEGVDLPEDDPDPIRRLALSILGEDCGDPEAARAIEKLLSTVVDWNEVRVSSPDQVHRAMGHRIPDGLNRARRLIRALQGIYEHEHAIGLDRLRSKGRREARQFLESIPGVNDYAAAAVMLWCFGGHAIPINDAGLTALRDGGLVHPQATRVEVQAFLERNIPAAQAKEFAVRLRDFRPARKGTGAATAKGPRKTVAR